MDQILVLISYYSRERDGSKSCLKINSTRYTYSLLYFMLIEANFELVQGGWVVRSVQNITTSVLNSGYNQAMTLYVRCYRFSFNGNHDIL